jgi:hypothetical protein
MVMIHAINQLMRMLRITGNSSKMRTLQQNEWQE